MKSRKNGHKRALLPVICAYVVSNYSSISIHQYIFGGCSDLCPRRPVQTKPRQLQLASR
ncbi:uncharacterized protein BDV14DRAFT_170890 [Aspergillus stella-maris]|uniref:uncharacterized protein n=1 Tax=Aspergillus stella-maris TaxID=1810926 RepID=UPI003CCD83AB